MGEVGRSSNLMVGDEKWEGGRKIMRKLFGKPCLSCLLNNTDKYGYIRSLDEVPVSSRTSSEMETGITYIN